MLVHGGWGNPDDWQWVAELLTDAGVEVAAPDLPSHRTTSAGVAEDVAEVRRAVAEMKPPVVLVGWSYGGAVITRTAMEEPSVVHLVYIGWIPETGLPEGAASDIAAFFEQDPHIDMRDDGTFVLDNDWWLNEEAGSTFADDVREVLRHHPRRPSTLKTLQLPPAEPVWERIPATVLLGSNDTMISAESRDNARALKVDVRILDTDHFLLFRQPEVVAGTVLESLTPGT